MKKCIKNLELEILNNLIGEDVEHYLKSQKTLILEIYNKNKLIYQKNIIVSNELMGLVSNEINNFIKINNYNIVLSDLGFKLNKNLLELSIPIDGDKNSFKAYIYDKNDLKKQLKEFIKENKMNEAQEEIIISEFEENNPYLKNKKDIIEQISELILSQIDRNELSELISNKDMSITNVIDTDLSDEIKKIVIDSLDKPLKNFDNLINVVKTEKAYDLYICDYLITNIEYKIQFSID